MNEGLQDKPIGLLVRVRTILLQSRLNSVAPRRPPGFLLFTQGFFQLLKHGLDDGGEWDGNQEAQDAEGGGSGEEGNHYDDRVEPQPGPDDLWRYENGLDD